MARNKIEFSMPQYTHVACICFLSFVFCLSTEPAFSRDIVVIGGLTTSTEFYKRNYKEDSTGSTDSSGTDSSTTQQSTASTTTPPDDRYSRQRVAPLVEISAKDEHNELSLQYSPGFLYDYDTSHHDVDHDLNADFKQAITRDWVARLHEKYQKTDTGILQNNNQTPTQTGSTVNVSDTQGRRTYWTNEASLFSDYTYGEDSLVTIGYTFNKLENVDTPSNSSYENFDRHVGVASIGYRFNPFWKWMATGQYVRGLYDSLTDQTNTTSTTSTSKTYNKDVLEYHGSTSLESRFIEHNPLTLSYSIASFDYYDSQLANSTLQDVTLGWQWDYSKTLQIGLGAGPSYQKTTGAIGTWGYNGNAHIKYGFERGTVELSAVRGYDRQNFTGTTENGLMKFWDTKFDCKYEVLQDLIFDIYATYRSEDQDQITQVAATSGSSDSSTSDPQYTTDTFNRQKTGAGSSLGYKFWQYYTMSLTYTFINQDSEKTNDSYNDHRFVLALSAKNELFRW